MQSDILTEVLRAVRMSGAIFFDIEASTPWVAQAPPSREFAHLVIPGAQHVFGYHVLVGGTCWAGLVTDGAVPIELAPGSIVIFPHGDPHVLASEPHLRAKPTLGIYAPSSPEDTLPFYLDPGQGGPQGARIICGFLGCDARPFNPLVAALPRMVHVPGATSGDDWLGTLIQAVLRESRGQRLGRGGVLGRLSELIFIEAVRRYAEAQPDGAGGWLVGLGDPLVGRALRALHREPARAWTLGDLARAAGASRTTLAERFTGHVGMPPMTYLGKWRMQIAAAHLAGNAETLQQVAAIVGYESEAAFSRAFKRTAGMAPSEWRRTARAS